MPGRHWDTTVTEAIKIPKGKTNNVRISDQNSRDIHRLKVKQRLTFCLMTWILHPGKEAVQFSTYFHTDTFKTKTARDIFPFSPCTWHSHGNPPPDASRKDVYRSSHRSVNISLALHDKNPDHSNRAPHTDNALPQPPYPILTAELSSSNS